MSTRSGKRIHSSLHEDDIKVDTELVIKAERKTRSKLLKENKEETEGTVSKLKKRHNYVSYPTDDEHLGDTVEKEGKSTRKTKRLTLKEHDINIPDTENIDSNIVGNAEAKKSNRVTRQTKKIPENEEELLQNVVNTFTTESKAIPNGKVKGKKSKRKKSKNSDANENEVNNVEVKTVVSKKSKKKKKKGKRSNTSTEDIQTHIFNRSNMSTDSFHSAAGSPVAEVIQETQSKNTPEGKKLDKTSEKSVLVQPSGSYTIFEKIATPKRKSSIKNTIPEKDDVCFSTNISKDANSTYKKIDFVKTSGSNTTFEKRATPKRNSSIKNTVPEKDFSLPVNTSEAANSTCNKLKEESSEKINITFEKETKRRKSLRSNNSTVESINDSTSATLNMTFEKTSDKKQSKTISLDTTFDKSDPKLNTTFDKTESKSNSAKSSLISSDCTVNLTYDKDDNSRISITSDESKTENIVNTTPVLIESSMDESHMSASKKSIEDLDTSNENHLKEVSLKPQAMATPVTPLKREGTFTKDSPEVMRKRSSNQTPTKPASLPYPGNTPFHVSRSSTKEKSILNVTRSIEKPTRRSSLAAAAPRQTRVMFCSPVNNPALVTQQRKKVIKSSLKGSNKSFVFDEKESSARPAVRKRSYTHNDAEDTRAKRTRLADDLQQSVDRLSRPRTTSAAAKLDNTPAKKPLTPSKPKSDSKRTKLPDFKSLHQKQFDKMESLDECQRRKARRARQLLTPTGGVEVLERSSPRGTTETTKSDKKDPIKKTDTPTKAPKLPTLESLRSGYTRFGFKMNSNVINPFSIPSKTDNKTKEKPEKTNGLNAKVLAPKTPNAVLPTSQDKPLQRQPTLPSLNGNTVTRKEVAKQAVMREKSFTSLSKKRDVTRSESRTIIKGVRTNRRFELQMKMRNID